VRANPYETERYLHEYLLFHYGRADELCPFSFVPREWLRFHERLREEYLLPVASRSQLLGLDVGCAVGRFTFELGRVLDRVIGVDNSRSFIQSAQRMAKGHSLTAKLLVSGARFTRRKLTLTKVLRRASVEFHVGDALNLRPFAGRGFQVVSAINLIDRLPRPRQFLQQLPRLVAQGGQLLLASPFTWLDQFTSSKRWLTSEQVQSLLRPDFRLVRHGELPFLIREHRRKYQLVVSEVCTFIRS
jgi:SAM-dependent methyltransferase